MKKTIRPLIRAAVALAAAFGGLLFALLTALWLFPGEAFRWGASFAERAGVTVSLPRVGGNPAAGWRFDAVTVEGPSFSMSARRIYVDVDWASLALGHPGLDALWADGLSIRARPSTAPEPEKKPVESGPMSLPAIDDLRLTDARFSFEKPDAEPIDISRLSFEGRVLPTAVEFDRLAARVHGNDLAAKGRYDVVTKSGRIDAVAPECLQWPGASVLETHCVSRVAASVRVDGNDLVVERFSANVAASTVTASGAFTIQPFAGKITMASEGPLVVHASASGDAAGWKGGGEARMGENALTFSGGVTLGAVPAYELSAHAANVPATVVPGLPANLGKISGDLTASGSGKTPASLNGTGRVRLTTSNGPALAGDVTLRDGTADTALTLAGGGVDGRVTGRWNLARSQGRADARLTLTGKKLTLWAGVAADGDVSASLSGKWPDLRWEMTADLKTIAAQDLSIGHATLKAKGDKLSPPAGEGSLEIADLVQGAQRVDSARLAASGSAARHRIEIDADSQGRTVRGRASGSADGGGWTSTWGELMLKVGDEWKLRQPFTLAAGAGGVRVDGLRLESGKALIAADGGIRDGRLQGVHLRTESVSLQPILKSLENPIDLAGLVSADITASGAPAAPEGRIAARVADLAVNGRPAGALNVEARSTGGRLYFDAVTLSGPAGRLDASGSVPISFSGKKAPPVQVRLRTDGLDPSALPLPEGIRFEKAKLNGDLFIDAGPGRFNARGGLFFTAGEFEMEDAGLLLTEVDLRLAADGKELRITRGQAKTKKGTIAVEGQVSASSVGVTLRARDFQIDHPAGIFIRSDADLALAGTWDSPRLTGTIDIDRADINPGNAKKKSRKERREEKRKEKQEKAAEAAAPRQAPGRGSPLSADVRIVFDNNVWYKDGQSAIEFRGNLNAQKDAGSDPRLYGTIETVRGEYIFYGRSFAFDRGRLTFLGQTPPDPQLDIAATYVTDQNNVKIHLKAQGPLSRPELSLTSEPPMEETDIVQTLVSGAPQGQGASSEEQARLIAANFLAEKLRSKLQNRLSIDQLKVKLNEQGAAEVTVGQNVTEDLYVSYARTLGAEGERRLNAEYTLTPIWSLNGSTSSIGRYVIDLLFKFGFH